MIFIACLGGFDRFQGKNKLKITKNLILLYVHTVYSNALYLTRYRTKTHNQTARKMETSELTKRILRKMLKNDVDLYEMARFLFHEKFQHYTNNDLFIKEGNL